MATFEQAIPTILAHEGGFVDHPSDPGGATNYGVSLRFIKDHPDLGDVDGDGDVDVEDILNMTRSQAADIYKQLWWDKYNYGAIHDQTLATKVFDLSVNMGASRAHKLLQTAINRAFGMSITVDGVIGPATRSIVNACDDVSEQVLLSAYCDEAFGFYQRLIANKPSLRVFEKGWKRRAYSLASANSLG